MRITLNQDEIFEAVADYLRGKLNLGSAASIEISFTAGRGPKGYTADVDITYPKSELASRIAAADPEPVDDPEPMSPGEAEDSAPPTIPAGIVSPSLFA